MTELDVTIELQTDGASALIRCGSCGAEQLLWATNEAMAQGAATAFTDEHTHCADEVWAAMRDVPRFSQPSSG
jgi:hypothetical protein